MWIFDERLELDPEKYGSTPRVYIEASLDKAILIGLQQMMQKALPCDMVVTFETDHSPFASAPEDPAKTFDEIARRYAS